MIIDSKLKNKLKTGMVVETRDGWRGIVLKDTDYKYSYDKYDKEGYIVGLSGRRDEYDYMPLSDYTHTLSLRPPRDTDWSRDLDIVKIYQPKFSTDFFEYCMNNDIDKLGEVIYDRETPSDVGSLVI